MNYTIKLSERHLNRDQRLLLRVESDIAIKGVTYRTRKDEREGAVANLNEDIYDEKLYIAIYTMDGLYIILTFLIFILKFEK